VPVVARNSLRRVAKSKSHSSLDRRRIPMRERRRHPRYNISVSVLGSVVDAMGEVRGLSGDTTNVSREGVALALHAGEDTIDLLPRLLPETQPVTLEIQLSALGTRIRATGSIRWHDICHVAGSRRYFIVGIFLEHMEEADRAKWQQFVGDPA